MKISSPKVQESLMHRMEKKTLFRIVPAKLVIAGNKTATV